MSFKTEFISAAETFNLRSRVLRPGLPTELSHFPGDEASTTIHLGIRDSETSEVICNGTLMQNICPLFPEHTTAYRLRGMATDPNYQGKGLGKILIAFAEEVLKKKQISFFWFNARQSAFGFYEKCGYQMTGELFDIPTVGPHKVMYKILK